MAPSPASGPAGRSSVLSVGQGLIELEFRNGFRIGGVESGRSDRTRTP